MTEQNPPSWMENGTHPSKNDRNMLAALVETEGIVKTTDLAVSFPSASMDVAIAAGDLFMLGDAARQGMYHVWNDASVTKTLVAGEGNPRKDLIVARLRDDFIDSSGVNTWALEIVKGTAAASPVEPTVPANSYVLSMINVPAGTTNLQATGVLNDRRTTFKVRQASSKVVVPNRQDATGATTNSYSDKGASTVIAVPSWATTAIITTMIFGLAAGSGGDSLWARTHLGGITTPERRIGPVAANALAHMSFTEQITGFATGAAVTLKTQLHDGNSGHFTFNTNCYVDLLIEFLP